MSPPRSKLVEMTGDFKLKIRVITDFFDEFSSASFKGYSSAHL